MSAIHWREPGYHAKQHNALRALSDAGNHFVATMREWHRRARDRARLAELDERTLRDIGLTGADAQFLINKPFWRE